MALIQRSPPVLSIEARCAVELLRWTTILFPQRTTLGSADAYALPRAVDPRSHLPRPSARPQRAADLVRCRHYRRHDGRRDHGRNLLRIDGAARRRLAYGNPCRSTWDRRCRVSV